MKNIIRKIAREQIGLPTLKARGQHAFDIRSIHLSQIEAALTAAYQAGQKAQPQGVELATAVEFHDALDAAGIESHQGYETLKYMLNHLVSDDTDMDRFPRMRRDEADRGTYVASWTMVDDECLAAGEPVDF